MRELFFKLFEQSHFGTGISIQPFNFAHIFYMLVIFGSIVGGFFLLHKKDKAEIAKIKEEIPMTPEIEYIISFIESSSRGIIR